MNSYHFWEKLSDDTSNPSTSEAPTPDLEQTPSTPPAQGAAPPDPHAEDTHKLDLEGQEMALQHKQELHEQRMRHTEELHSVKMQTSGSPSGGASAQGAQQQPAPPMDPQQAQAASQSNLLANYIQTKMGESPEEEGADEAVVNSVRFFKVAKDLIRGGKAKGMSASEFPSDQLRMGVKVEKEHTPNPAIAEEIVKDHLEEFDNYYTGLDKMEKKLEAQKEKKAEWHELKKEIFRHIQIHS